MRQLPKPDEIRCVYCLETRSRPAHGEHIILKGLGGRATIPFVCGGPGSCNQKLGDELDVEMLRNSFIALHRYYDPKISKGQVGGMQLIPSKFGGGFDGKAFNDGSVELLPQMAVLGEKVIIAADSSKQADVDAVLESLKGLDTVFKEIVLDTPENEPPRIVLDLSKNGRHRVRGRTQADVDRVKDVLRRGIVGRQNVDRDDVIEPQMRIKVSMELNTVSRCAAKMAFNFATAIFGAAAMIRPQFHPVRTYILGDAIVKPLRTDTEGRIFADLDDRFVENWTHRRVPSDVVGATTDHSIELLELGGQLGARMALVGGAERFQIRLGPLHGLDSARLPAYLVRTDEDDYWYVNGHVVPNGYLKGVDAAISAAFNGAKSPLRR